MTCIIAIIMYDYLANKRLLLLYSFTVIDAIVKEKFTVMYHTLCHGLYNSLLLHDKIIFALVSQYTSVLYSMI